MKDEIIQVDFYCENKKYAERYLYHVPIIGDEVRFKGVAYKVVYRIWTYDEDFPRVAMSIKKVEDKEK